MKKFNLFLLAALLLVSVAQAQLPAYLPAAGLVAWFPFTGNAVDSTLNGHDGTVYGTTMGSGRYGQPNTAFNFNGVSDYIYVPPGTLVKERSVDITASLTISAWVKSTNYAFSSQEQIYWRGDATPAHDPHMLYLNGGQVRVRRDIDPGATITEAGYSFAGLDTNYHLFTGTYDSASGFMCMYIDGIRKAKNYLPGLQTYPTSTMYNYIGAVDGGTWQFFYGLIDELGIWNRALTPCEVAALYSSVSHIITGHPVNDSAVSGSIATFAISVAAPAPLYQWQVNTGSGFVNLTNASPYSGVYTSTLTINPANGSMSGNLYRCIVSSDSCVNVISDSAALIVNTVGISANQQEQENITISPNPNNGDFTIFCSSAKSPVHIVITDIIGQVIGRQVLQPVNGVINQPALISNRLSSGIYFLHAKAEGLNKVFQVIVNK